MYGFDDVDKIIAEGNLEKLRMLKITLTRVLQQIDLALKVLHPQKHEAAVICLREGRKFVEAVYQGVSDALSQYSPENLN